MNETTQPAVAGPVEPTVRPLAERLRADIETWEGHYSDEMFVRYFPAPPLQLEAADELDRLQDELMFLRRVLHDLMQTGVAQQTLWALRGGQGTNTKDGEAWLAAASFAKATDEWA